MKFKKAILPIVTILSTCLSTSAQDANPLLAVLALVPDNAFVQSGFPTVMYADLRVAEAARGISTPTIQNFEDETDIVGLWFSGPGMMLREDRLGDQIISMETLVGFSWLDVNQKAVYGTQRNETTPSVTTILTGNFDTEHVNMAFEARNYTQESDGEIQIWCGSVGCEKGWQINLDDRNLINPFGGSLGMQHPIGIAPNFIVTSAEFTSIEASIQAYQKTAPSLADNPDYIAASEAITTTGFVRQLHFYSGESLRDFEVYAVSGMSKDDVIELAQEHGELPSFNLAFIADTWKETNEFGIIGLVYDHAEDAETAIEILALRMFNYYSTAAREPLFNGGVVAHEGGQFDDGYTYTSAGVGRFVTMMVFSKPLPPNTRVDGRFELSGRLFTRFTNEIGLGYYGFLASNYQ
jgi:hypothetical protein